ncbi:MAG: hypothetical protein ACR2NZ_05185 [Rubripirellula sp.]
MSHTLRNTSTCVMLLFLAPAAYSETESPDEDSPQQLSVAPLDHVVYPDSRPEWINQAADVSNDEARFVVVSGPCDSPEESLEELNIMQRAALATFISSVTGSGGSYDFYPLSEERMQKFIEQSYEGQVTAGDATRYEHAVEMVVSAADRKQIEQAWKSLEVRDRLGALGVMVFGGLIVLMGSSAVLGMTTRRIERREKLSSSSADVV